MTIAQTTTQTTILQKMDKLAPSIKALIEPLTAYYKDFHENPELSNHEVRTAGILDEQVKKLGFDVHEKLGGTGIVAILKNGDGNTVMLRADMDALPIEEKTGAPFASKKTGISEEGLKVPVSHMCGHDLHISWMLGAADIFAKNKDIWKGTLMIVFQPAEETASGALAMLEDMQDKFPKPDIILGQHVMPGEAGTVLYRAGPYLAAGDSLHVKLIGRGGHGSMPQNSIDPVMMAAYTATRLQTIISRETSPFDNAVLTIGSIQAGTKENVIPDDATLKINVRTYNETVKAKVLSSVKRICYCECEASGATEKPQFTVIDSYPVTDNDIEATKKVSENFIGYFGKRSFQGKPVSGSEDFSQFGRKWNVPYVFWLVGSTKKSVWDEAVKTNNFDNVPTNHSSKFLPELTPTMQTGLEAMVVAALTWL